MTTSLQEECQALHDVITLGAAVKNCKRDSLKNSLDTIEVEVLYSINYSIL